MSNNGPFETIPNEVLRLILSHLLSGGLQSVMRTQKQWKLLGNTLLGKEHFEREYPYLPDPFPDGVTLFKN